MLLCTHFATIRKSVGLKGLTYVIVTFVECEHSVHKVCMETIKENCIGKKSVRRPQSGIFQKSSGMQLMQILMQNYFLWGLRVCKLLSGFMVVPFMFVIQAASYVLFAGDTFCITV